MRNILFFTDTPLFGGAEQQMFLLAKFVDRTKYKISLACLDSPHLNRLCEKFQNENLPVYRLPYRHKHDPRTIFPLSRIIRENHINLIHLHLWNPASCRFGLLVSRLTKTPVIITEHDPFEISKLKKLIKTLLVGKPKAVIAISRGNEDFLKKEYGGIAENIIYIPNGIDVDFWNQQREKYKDKKTGGQIITNIATLHERKGQDILIEAFARIAEKYPNAKLWLVGDGPARMQYESLAKSKNLEGKIQFFGQRSDIPVILSNTTIFAYPSRREALGMALLEAGMMKLPVVAANVGGIPDIIKHEKTGLLVESENVESLVTNLERLLKDEPFMISLGENLFHKVEREFSAKHMAEQVELIYTQTLK